MQLQNSINRILMFLLVLLPFVFTPDFVDVFFIGKAFLLPIASLLILFKWLLYEKNKQIQVMAFSWPIKFTVIYWLLNAVSLYYSIDILRSFMGFSNGWNGFIIITCYCLVLIFASLYFSLTERRIQILVTAGSAMGLIALLQFFRILEDDVFIYPMREVFSRAYGTLGNPNYLGAYLTVFLPIAIYQFFMTRYNIYLGASALMYAALLGSMTRATWLGCIFAIVILMVFSRKEPGFRKSVLYLVALFAAVTLVMDLLLNGLILLRFFAIFGSFMDLAGPGEVEDGAAFRRILLWRQGLLTIFENPWFGIGSGNMQYAFLKIPNSEAVFGGLVNNTHNEYIHIAATTGIPSLIAYLLMILSSLKLTWENLRNHPVNILFLAIIVGYSVQAFFSSSIVSFSFIPWIVTGTAVYENTRDRARTRELVVASDDEVYADIEA